jgi:PAS domain S-box-containing protein
MVLQLVGGARGVRGDSTPHRNPSTIWTGGAALREPERRETFSPRIVDSLVDAVVLVDERGTVLYANPAVQRLLGWDVSSLFGVPFTKLLPERRNGSEAVHALMEADPLRRSRAPMRTFLVCADGSELPVDMAVSVVDPAPGPRLVIAVIWDASDRIDIERYQRVSEDLLAFLARASGTTEEIVPQLLGILCSTLDFELATAWRWDPESELLICEHAWRVDVTDFQTVLSTSIGTTVRTGEELPGLVVRSNQPVWMSELTDATHLRRHQAIVADGVHTAFIFPIRTRERLVGVIELLTRTHRKPDQPLFDAVADVGAKLGEFIERLELESDRKDLLAQLERSHRHQDFLLRANRALAEAGGFQDAVRKLADVAVPTLGDICLIDVLDSDGKLNRMAARNANPADQPLTDGLSKHAPDLAGSHPAALAVRRRQSQWSADMNEIFMRNTTRGDDHYRLTKALGFESYLSVPLLADGEAIGALTLVSAGSGRTIGREELWLAEDLAAQVATVIRRTRAFDEQSTIARHLQRSLLPQSVDQNPHITVAVRYVTGDRGTQVGGDFYDVIPLPKGHVALAIGDVEGHDMTAATVMGQLRSALRAYLMLNREPGVVLSMLNEFALKSESPRLATATLAVLNSATGAIEVASAGHPAPLMSVGNTPATSVPMTTGPPLGVHRYTYPAVTSTLEPGALLVFYTDGLIDVGRPGAEQKLDQLARAMESQPSGACDELADRILLEQVGPEGKSLDDVALLVVEWEGPPPELRHRG